ncbi:MAG: phenylalanine--tRNA ligase subunit alpha [Parachlamydia sp.]|nr:MAG: phenylalanine--tRNA ligase subunit alpha [Parachlamydia sp.]
MNKTIDSLRDEFANELRSARSTTDLEHIKVKYLGKKGPLQNLMKSLRDVAPEHRPEVGKLINILKEEIESALEGMQTQLISIEEHDQLQKEIIDITLPGRKKFAGRKHIITQVLDQMIDILVEMGFSVQYGPDIDSDYYNFEALNFPPDHPARDMQDTFYLSSDMLLRTQTSNIQARIMEAQRPPIRMICPGKVYRNETITARSHVFFHQVEAMYIDIGVTFTDLLATMDQFVAKFFGREIETRYRPSYFPFVEPGMEVDISCLNCHRSGCNLCKHTGWLEIAGAGMIHPEVLKFGNIDSELYTGFAWGMGVERLILLKHGVNDIRLFTENDTRFLAQFPEV